MHMCDCVLLSRYRPVNALHRLGDDAVGLCESILDGREGEAGFRMSVRMGVRIGAVAVRMIMTSSSEVLVNLKDCVECLRASKTLH